MPNSLNRIFERKHCAVLILALVCVISSYKMLAFSPINFGDKYILASEMSLQKNNDNYDEKQQMKILMRALENREGLFVKPAGYFTIKGFFSPEVIEEVSKIGNDWMLPKAGPSVSKIYWATDGLRWRCDEKQVVPNSSPYKHVQQAYDGERYFVYSPAVEELIISNDDIGPRFSTGVFYLMNEWANQPLSHYLSTHEYSISGWEKRDGEDCLKVTVDASSPKYYQNIIFWFSRAHELATIEIQSLSQERGANVAIGRIFKAEKMKQHSSGLWLPNQCTRETYALKTGQAPQWRSTDVFTVEELTINTANIDAKFQIPVTLGTKIYSEPGQLPSIVGGRIDLDVVSLEKDPVQHKLSPDLLIK